jgi:hypothetical protein
LDWGKLTDLQIFNPYEFVDTLFTAEKENDPSLPSSLTNGEIRKQILNLGLKILLIPRSFEADPAGGYSVYDPRYFCRYCNNKYL